MHHHLRLFIGVMLVASALTPGWEAVCAQDPVVPSIEEMARRSDVVIVAQIQEGRSRWVDRMIYTTHEIKIIKTLKGEELSPVRWVTFQGGVVGMFGVHVSHEVTVQEGEVAVLFLVPSGNGSGSSTADMRIVDEFGKIPLLQPGQSLSRLDRNRRMQRFLANLEKRVERGGDHEEPNY